MRLLCPQCCMIRATDMKLRRFCLLAVVVELEHKFAVIATNTDTICCRIVK